MKPILPAILVLALLAACGGNPFLVEEEVIIDNDTTGTANATAKTPIKRSEKKDPAATGPDLGNGYATGIRIEDPDPDTEGDETFIVDGLAFDGENVFQRGTAMSELGSGTKPFAVYEGAESLTDGNGTEIHQYEYRAVYGVSATGKTNFAIVRTGSFIDYGFGGFIYERTGRVTLPTTGQASYSGQYAGLRDFNNRGGLEYVSGTMNVAVDFNDFNEGAGVDGEVIDRAIYDINGADITSDVIDALNTSLAESPNPVTGETVVLDALPVLRFKVGPGVAKPSGELAGSLTSGYVNNTGAVEKFEAGKFYALISDSPTGNANEVVGIIRVEADDPRYEGVTVRETGGFILYHIPPA
jgi:hypothetical protein